MSLYYRVSFIGIRSILLSYTLSKKKGFFCKKPTLRFTIADPADGMIKVDKSGLLQMWANGIDGKGTALLLHPEKPFYDQLMTKPKSKNIALSLRYLSPHKNLIVQIAFTLLIGSVISLGFPLLMQILIDQGVNGKNIHIVYLIILSQLMLFAGDTILDNIRSWLLMHAGIRISFMIISDFLHKLFRLPISFFDSKKIGDFSQRIDDHQRIERFLTDSMLHTLFSLISVIAFTLIIAYYDIKILWAYLLLNASGVIWILLFKDRRRILDARFFSNKRKMIDKFYEMIVGMQEIKLYNNEKGKILQWEHLQLAHFKLNEQSVRLQQYQHSGFMTFMSIRNIIISFISATAVIQGNMTLGILLSISYIVGQTNGPITQLVDFTKLAQDAKLSIERLEEIHCKPEEENAIFEGNSVVFSDIVVQNLSFQFEGKFSPFVLRDLIFTIPAGKTTAIVGSSGSGKTTFLKLLLKFYEPVSGAIIMSGLSLSEISAKMWRSQCGTVMQEGYLFNDTIANNMVSSPKKSTVNL